MPWIHASLTDRGRRRPRNEDALLVHPERRLFAVADGMGGHAAGDVASRLAVATLAASFPRAPSTRIGRETLGRRLLAALSNAHQAILAQGVALPEQAGMGTTLTAFAPLARAGALIAHIGDSRAYRLRHGHLEQLTRDHTWVQQQVDAGMLTRGAARSHPWSSVLVRVLGGPGEAELYHVDVRDGDRFLLCTDGLCGVVEDADLEAIVAQPLPLDNVALHLLEAALLRGGPDNITLVLLQFHATAL